MSSFPIKTTATPPRNSEETALGACRGAGNGD